MAGDGSDPRVDMAGRFDEQRPEADWLLHVPREQRAVDRVGVARQRVGARRAAGRSCCAQHPRREQERVAGQSFGRGGAGQSFGRGPTSSFPPLGSVDARVPGAAPAILWPDWFARPAWGGPAPASENFGSASLESRLRSPLGHARMPAEWPSGGLSRARCQPSENFVSASLESRLARASVTRACGLNGQVGD